MALEAYFDRRDHEGSKTAADRGRAAKRIIPIIGDIIVDDLTRDKLTKWQAGVAAAKPHLGAAKRDRTAGDAARAAKATANRTMTLVRAALTQAFRDGKVTSDAAWRSVKPFRDAGASRLRYYTSDEVRITGGSFHSLRHTAASHMVMAGVPLNVVAHNLGHSDTRMCEKHYAHLAPSYIAETIRKFTPDFGLPDESNVVSIGWI